MARQRGSSVAVPEKVCATCGRRFAWRKKWARDWEAVRYCSRRCRGQRPSGVAADLEDALLAALADAPSGRWKPLTPAGLGLSVTDERLRQAARRLAVGGKVELGMGGRVVDPTAVRGAVQVRRCRAPTGGR